MESLRWKGRLQWNYAESGSSISMATFDSDSGASSADVDPISYSSGYKPVFNNYQMLGDRYFQQLAELHLGYPLNAVNGIGYCEADQTIRKLTKRIRVREFPIMENVILFIGNYDMVMGRGFESMCKDFRGLLRELKQQNVERIVVLTLPPILMYAAMPGHWVLVQNFNSFLRGLHSQNTGTYVLDVYREFVPFDVPVITDLVNESGGCCDWIKRLVDAAIRRGEVFRAGRILPVCDYVFFQRIRYAVLLSTPGDALYLTKPPNYNPREYFVNNMADILPVAWNIITAEYYVAYGELTETLDLNDAGITALFRLLKSLPTCDHLFSPI